jgi:hypothetical protein
MFDITDLARVQERSVRYGRGRRGEDASGEVVKPRWGQVFFVAGESGTATSLPSYHVPVCLLTLFRIDCIWLCRIRSWLPRYPSDRAFRYYPMLAYGPLTGSVV